MDEMHCYYIENLISLNTCVQAVRDKRRTTAPAQAPTPPAKSDFSNLAFGNVLLPTTTATTFEKLVFGLFSLILIILLGQTHENMKNTQNLDGRIS